jgi:hypothetical protein
LETGERGLVCACSSLSQNTAIDWRAIRTHAVRDWRRWCSQPGVGKGLSLLCSYSIKGPLRGSYNTCARGFCPPPDDEVSERWTISRRRHFALGQLRPAPGRKLTPSWRSWEARSPIIHELEVTGARGCERRFKTSGTLERFM